MNFTFYNILSSLVPGFLVLLVVLNFLDLTFEKDFVIAYTAIAFLLGFLVNTLSSWLEDFYFFTWSGKPSVQLMKGKDIWKVRFYHSEEVINLLKMETTKPNPSFDELFSIAMRYASQKDNRFEDFNTVYAFSRSLLTCILTGSTLLLIKNYNEWQLYLVLIPIIIIVWLRCKQRAYYHAREVLNIYLTIKKSIK